MRLSQYLCVIALFPASASALEPDAEVMKRGMAIYLRSCKPCHGETGLGLPPIFPPLVGLERIHRDSSVFVRIIVNGLTGPTSVNGRSYSVPMNPVQLPEKNIAELITFVNNSWGNAGPTVTELEVAAIRKKYAGRKTHWTSDELQKEAPAKK